MKLVFSSVKLWVFILLLLVMALIWLIATKSSLSESEAQHEAVDQVLKTDVAEPLSVIAPELDVAEPLPELEPEPDAVESEFEPSKSKPESSGPFAPTEALKVQESFKVEPPMQSIGQNWKTGRKTSNFTMPVSEGRDLEIQVERFESIGEEGGEFTGTVVGAPGSKVNLSYRGSAEAGRIDIPSEGRSYQILPAQDGAIIVQDRNPSLEPQAGALFQPEGIELPPVPNFIPPPPPSGIFKAIPPAEPLP